MTACIGSGPGRLFEARYPMTQPDSPTAVEHAEQVTPDAIMPLGLAFWGSTTLLSAVELGLFAVIGKAGGLHAEELRQRLGLHPRRGRDFFDALVALGMLARRRTVLNHCGDRTLPRPGKAGIRRRPFGDGCLISSTLHGAVAIRAGHVRSLSAAQTKSFSLHAKWDADRSHGRRCGGAGGRPVQCSSGEWVACMPLTMIASP